MGIFAVSLDPEDVQYNSNNLTIYNVRNNSFEGMKKFILGSYPRVIEESIKIFCLDSGAVFYATFATEGDDHKKLHWNVSANHIFTV